MTAPSHPLLAGAASGEITPSGSVFLFGYPHVPRWSTGVNDPLECSVLYLRRGERHALFIATDVILVSKAMTARIRDGIATRTGIPPGSIMVTATHTHSGPVMADYLSNAADPVVPKADPAYLQFFHHRVVAVAAAAVQAAVPAEVGVGTAQRPQIGTNRHAPDGPTDVDVPVVVARCARSRQPLGCLLVCAMHPTVLHEDSTLISADFPGFTRRYLRRGVLPESCPVLFMQGAAGDQSPRHVTRANTFAEARRLGELLGQTVADVLPRLHYASDLELSSRLTFLPLVPRSFPLPDEATRQVGQARGRLESLRARQAPRPEIRTAECDLFGAEELAELSRAALDGRLAAAIAACVPAEIQAISIGPWTFVGWPGEFFVEYALELRRQVPRTFAVTLANGELQGYIVTENAADRGTYEANNAVFSASNGSLFVTRTTELISG